MLKNNDKYLEFLCGPYRLLIDINYIVEISDYSENWCGISGNSIKHNRKIVSWKNTDLLFIDMRVALDIEPSTIKQPTHTLVLKDINTDIAFAMIAIDEVQHIVEIHESQWYVLNGINPRLDVFFDRAYSNKKIGQICMRLAPPKQWATGYTEVSHAY